MTSTTRLKALKPTRRSAGDSVEAPIPGLVRTLLHILAFVVASLSMIKVSFNHETTSVHSTRKGTFPRLTSAFALANSHERWPEMKGLPLLLTGMSGSLGGLVFSHNRGGAYVRNRGIPTQPNTSFQTIVKGFFSQLSTAWRATLTAAQRSAWDGYAAATPLIDALGNPFFPTGLNMYIRGNIGILQNGNSRIDDGPITAGLPTATPPQLTSMTAATDIALVAFTGTDGWVSADDTHMLIYASRGKSATINFFKGPYQLAGSIDGDSGVAPTSPATITVPFNIGVGQKVFFRATLMDAEGRKGPDIFFSGLAV